MAATAKGHVDATCDDFLQFQEMLKNLRLMDDRIIHALNTTIPTDSFSSQVDANAKCQELYKEKNFLQLCQGYSNRDTLIKSCISQLSSNIAMHKTKLQKEADDDPHSLKMLRNEQARLRILQSEVNIEEVVKDRTLKVFNERCRNFYKPPPSNLL